MSIFQKTISKMIIISGIGLHTGLRVNLKILPSDINTGIMFRRVDIANSPIVRANIYNVCTNENSTTLQIQNFKIYTIEHLLASFYGLGVTNAICEVDGPEIPILDGSSAPFVYLILKSGIIEQNEILKILVIKSSIKTVFGDKYICAEPWNNLQIESSINFPHPSIKTQNYTFVFSKTNFINDLCRARTFGLLKDIDFLKRRGLVRGGTLDNAIVLDDSKVINVDGLRYDNEFAKHKTLDTLGDISLIGYKIIAKIKTRKSGHQIANNFCKELLSKPNLFKIVPASEYIKII